MTKPLDLSKPVMWKYGTDTRPARVVCTDYNSRSEMPILALVTNPEGYEVPIGFDAAGISGGGARLVNVSLKHKRWVNIYSDFAQSHHTKNDADMSASPERIACVEIEFEEGQGL